MKTISFSPDRVAGTSLNLLVGLHTLLFALLFTLAFLAVGQARAEVACTGQNLLTKLERDDPATLAKIRAEAAKTPNGRGVLWRVETAGVPASYLFGTMHVADPRVTELSPAAQAAFDGAATLVIETTDVLDQARMAAALAARPDLTMFTDGSTLASHLSPEDAEALRKGLDARGIPPDAVAKMKPWILSALVSLPACELARKAAGASVLDVKLAEEAKAADKPVEGLETAISQIEAMASLPIAFHVQGLVDTLKLGSKLDDLIETMVAIYESGETGLFWPLFHAEMPETPGSDSGYAAFEETMITSRNRIMADRATPLLRKGGVFMAVGALHLAGTEGVVELLRRKGFALSAVEYHTQEVICPP